jgi:Domain of unknown function (DUF4203)
MNMVNESFLTLACAGVIGAFFGLLLAFFGYRLFLILLPIWGFFFGLFLGADTMHYLFGYGFLATTTSWVVGFVVGAIFAVLSYFFYMAAVAVIAGSLGYVIAISIWLVLGLSTGFLAWLVAIIVAVAFIIVTFAFNLQKWVIMIATAILGTAATFGTFILLFNPAANFLENPVKVFLSLHPVALVVAVVMVVAAVVVQYQQNKNFTLETYNKWETE